VLAHRRYPGDRRRRIGTFPADLAATINAFAVGYVLVMAVLGTTLMGYSAPFERLAVDPSGSGESG